MTVWLVIYTDHWGVDYQTVGVCLTEERANAMARVLDAELLAQHYDLLLYFHTVGPMEVTQ